MFTLYLAIAARQQFMLSLASDSFLSPIALLNALGNQRSWYLTGQAKPKDLSLYTNNFCDSSYKTSYLLMALMVVEIFIFYQQIYVLFG